jgi:hypothetical protein
LRDIGTKPSQSNSRNALEQPWSMTPESFTRRERNGDPKTFTRARDETAALTEEIAKIERVALMWRTAPPRMPGERPSVRRPTVAVSFAYAGCGIVSASISTRSTS